MTDTRASSLANTLINITAMPKSAPRPRPQRAEAGRDSADISPAQEARARNDEGCESRTSDDAGRHDGRENETFDQVVRRMSEQTPKQTASEDSPTADEAEASGVDGELAGQVAQLLGLDEVVKPKISGEGLTLTPLAAADATAAEATGIDAAATGASAATNPSQPVAEATAGQVGQEVPAMLQAATDQQQGQGLAESVANAQQQVAQTGQQIQAGQQPLEQETAQQAEMTTDQPGKVQGQAVQGQQAVAAGETATRNTHQAQTAENPGQLAPQPTAETAGGTGQQPSSDTAGEDSGQGTAQELRFASDRKHEASVSEPTETAAPQQAQVPAIGQGPGKGLGEFAAATGRAESAGPGELAMHQAETDSARQVEALSTASPAQASGAPATQAAMLQNQPDVEGPVAAQLTQYMRSRNAQAGDDLVLRLDPPELGQVRMRLRTDNGELRLILEAENPRTLTQMQREGPALLQRLNESGIEVRRMDFAQSNSQFNDGGESFADLAGRQQSQAGNQPQADTGRGGGGSRRGARQASGYVGQVQSGDTGVSSRTGREQISDDSINLWM